MTTSQLNTVTLNTPTLKTKILSQAQQLKLHRAVRKPTAALCALFVRGARQLRRVADLCEGDQVHFVTSKSYSLAMLTSGAIRKQSSPTPDDAESSKVTVILKLPLESKPSWQVFAEIREDLVAWHQPGKGGVEGLQGFQWARTL